MNWLKYVGKEEQGGFDRKVLELYEQNMYKFRNTEYPFEIFGPFYFYSLDGYWTNGIVTLKKFIIIQ